MSDEDDELFPLAEPSEPADVPAGRPWGRWTLLVLSALVIAALVGLTVTLARTGSPAVAAAATTPPPPAPTTAAAPTSAVPPTAAPTSRPATTAPALPTAYRQLSAAQLAQAQRDLTSTTAELPTGVSLASPADWDRWGPAGKPYPGADTAEDISTCPHLADRLSAALGVRMSYWVGTLPGQGGCTWATVPLSYDGPYTYPYTVNVSFLAAGGDEPATTAWWRRHFYEAQGAFCPDADAPAVGEGAVLIACTADPGDPSYLLLLPDARGTGLWMLSADARSTAAHPASYALSTLVSLAKSTY